MKGGKVRGTTTKSILYYVFFHYRGERGQRGGYKYDSLTDNLLMVIKWRLSLRNISTDNDCKETFRMHMDIG